MTRAIPAATTKALVSDVFDCLQFKQRVIQNSNLILLYREALGSIQAGLFKAFSKGAPIASIVQARALILDQLLLIAWQHFQLPENEQIALVAVGGYGRGELHPGSDIDLLILVTNQRKLKEYQDKILPFLTFLWDTKLEIGHSVRTLSDCVRAAKADISVATNLMEGQLICGSAKLYDAMKVKTGPNKIWPSKAFFQAKWQEQIDRHKKFNDSSYNLEPNIKKSPGGLRDIQMIGWVAKRHFDASTLYDLVKHNFLTEPEYRVLIEGQHFLWAIRFALHSMTQRREDRLLFDYQKKVAELLGFNSANGKLAVELMMKKYYQTVMELSELNDMLLQYFQEVILISNPVKPEPINERFKLINDAIAVNNPNTFKETPSALLELFVIMAQRPQIKGVRATTIRLIREHRHLIDDHFRADDQNQALFMAFLRQPQGVSRQLRRMKRYGILGAYIPEFGQVQGQMQFDLFHIYTVDEHSLFVVQNIRGFYNSKQAHNFPICANLVKRIQKPELLIIAALFHDIAKGRGGDHSELGRIDAETFCQRHGISTYDTRLVSWLVQHHLTLSLTAQKKDLSDPEVIHDFAAAMRDRTHLDYLFLLTVADICATNHTLWNQYRASLIRTLYTMTQQALAQGLDNPVNQNQMIKETKLDAIALLEYKGLTLKEIIRVWSRCDKDYFLRETPSNIAWHTQLIHEHAASPAPLVDIRQKSEEGGTEIFIYCPDKDYLFASMTTAMYQLGLTIVNARLSTSKDNYALDTYSVLELNGHPIEDSLRLKHIHEVLIEQLTHSDRCIVEGYRAPSRRVRQFDLPTTVSFELDVTNNRTILEVTSLDRPGLLSRIANVFFDHKVLLQTAKITTIGERVDDVLFITDQNHQPIMDIARQNAIKKAILESI